MIGDIRIFCQVSFRCPSSLRDILAHIRLVGTNADILNGKGTGLPVSGCRLEFVTM